MCGMHEMWWKSYFPLTSHDKVGKEIHCGEKTKSLRSNSMLAELKWKVASTYFEFIFKDQILSCFLCLPHTLSLLLFSTNMIKLRVGHVPDIVLKALKSQEHELISCSEQTLWRRKKASFLTTRNEPAPEIVPTGLWKMLPPQLWLWLSVQPDRSCMCESVHRKQFLGSLTPRLVWLGSVMYLGSYRSGQSQPDMSKDICPPPFPFWCTVSTLLWSFTTSS